MKPELGVVDTLFPGEGSTSTSIWERRTDSEYRRQ